MSVALRPMSRRDLASVLTLEGDLFGREAWTEGMLSAELAGVPDGRYYLVAEDESLVVGYAGLLTAGGQADVLTMAVAEDHWGEGIGAALLGELLAEAGGGGAMRYSSRSGWTTPGRRTSTAGTGSPRLASGGATTSRQAPTHWSCGGPRSMPPGRPGPRPRQPRPHRRDGSPRPEADGGLRVTAPLVLGIETSCDETGAGLVRGHELLADAVASSVAEHARFGGVVPEVASRAHLEAMVPAVDRALATAGVTLADVDAIAVTAGPGLTGALLVVSAPPRRTPWPWASRCSR